MYQATQQSNSLFSRGVGLPALDGYGVARAIRADFPGYGTICGSDDPGGSTQEFIFEYWNVSAVISNERYAEISSWYPFDQQEGQRVAEQVHDWYSFEITDPGQRVELYLVWDEADVELASYCPLWRFAPADA